MVFGGRKPPTTKEIKYKTNEYMRTFGAASTCDHIETTPKSLFVVIVAKGVRLFVCVKV